MRKTEHAAGASNQRLVLAATAGNLWSPWPYMTCWGNDWSEMWLMIKKCWSIGHWPSGSCRLIWNEWCGNIWNWATLSLRTATYVVQLSGHGDIMVWYQSNRLNLTSIFRHNPFCMYHLIYELTGDAFILKVILCKYIDCYKQHSKTASSVEL